jgi:hypothetical protein
MPKRSFPPSLSVADERNRYNRAVKIANNLGFVGSIEYRHFYGRSGGAQYGQARLPEDDLLIIYADAFDRDTDPKEFSLEAIIAHERGHQVVVRHPRVSKLLVGLLTPSNEEVMASVIGSILCPNVADKDNLIAKATFDLIRCGRDRYTAVRQIDELELLLRKIL